MTSILLLAVVSLSVESRVDSVIVYPDQALVVRKALVTVSGSNQLAFEGLTGMLDDNSVRIRAPGLMMGEVQVKPGYTAQPTGPVKLLEDSLDKLKRQDRVLSDEQDVLKSEDSFLSSIKLGAPEMMSKELTVGKVDAANWGSALSFMSTQMVAVKKRAAELELLRKDLDKIKTAVSTELANAKSRWENRKTILLDVYAEQNGNYEVSLSYAVPSSVVWSPYYELRAAPSDQSVSLTYYARVSQHTNEDWADVKVILSTARPSAGGVAPEPSAWYLNLYEPEPPMRSRAGKGVMYAPGVAAMQSEDMAAAPIPPQAQTVETGISLQYVIPGTVSLKSGEDAKKVFLTQATLPADFFYYTYPRMEQIAYLRGKFLNNSKFIYLAGQGNTYVGDEFTGKTYLSSIAPGESANLSFGVDDRMKVKRELVSSTKGSAGLLSNRTKAEFVYKTTVESYQTRTIDLTVVEQVPVAQNKDIKVNVTKVDPQATEENRDLGTYTFKSQLKPQDKSTINLEYSVDYPNGKQISGLY